MPDIVAVKPLRRSLLRGFLPVISSMAILTACSSLPNSGPTAKEIEKDAADPATNKIGYHLLQLNPDVLAVLSASSVPRIDQTIADARANSVSRVGSGDILAISIFSASGGFSGAESGGNGLPVIEIPPETIDESGTIRVPFAGTVTVSGMTPQEISLLLEKRLTGRIFDPQVLVNVSRNIANTIIVSGDVHQPGRFPVMSADERILDVIAQCGGPTHPERDISVRLIRAGRTTRLSLQDMDENVIPNIRVLPGDRLRVSYEPRTFLSFGAADRVSEIPIEKANLSLAEAMAQIGGPSDFRADPTAVFLFRYEPAKTAQALGLGSPTEAVPVLYRVNMLDPQTYFETSKFPMRDRDLIYVANAASNKFYKFVGIINSAFGPIGSARNVTQ